MKNFKDFVNEIQLTAADWGLRAEHEQDLVATAIKKMKKEYDVVAYDIKGIISSERELKKMLKQWDRDSSDFQEMTGLNDKDFQKKIWQYMEVLIKYPEATWQVAK